MHEYKLRMQAQVRIQINIDNGLFFDIFEYATIKTHPKHVPTTLKGIRISSKPIPHQNLNIYLSKNGLKQKIKGKLESKKSLKTY